ncbi:MAG: alpha-amylase family glycosyl hydrolase [Lachnospiraceae bacterium]|jgi:alpha-glucosidase
MPAWLKDAVFYEIYPQSYNDTNGDGIGDLEGIIEKLDYIKSLGFNALWLNPCYDSPFRDAGYDVRDYRKIAPRYGTNEDAVRLFREAHRRGIHVLFDLVPGHTSEEHEWFRMSSRREKNEYSGRYIWSDFCFQGMDGYRIIAGEAERGATYMINFFKCQPALNYGFLHKTEPWQTAVGDPDAVATVEAIKDIIRFWLDLGLDGFRVDMADSLVKGDDDRKTGTSAIWRNVRAMLDAEYPEAAFVSEWSRPELSLPAGFHMDFILNNSDQAFGTLVRDYQNHTDRIIQGGDGFIGNGKPAPAFEDHSYFKKDAGGTVTKFSAQYTEMLQKTRKQGYISLITCNHDTVRPRFNMGYDELKLFYAFLFTMPGVPFLYYGDEIGMRYLDLPTKEGGYFRTGSRTPMQWNHETNYGFSDADPSKIYLPQDPAADAPTVADQEKDPRSLLNTVRSVLALRHAEKDLQADGEFASVFESDENPLFVYRRGGLILAVNPSGSARSAELPAVYRSEMKPVCTIGSGAYTGGKVTLGPQSFAVFRPEN